MPFAATATREGALNDEDGIRPGSSTYAAPWPVDSYVEVDHPPGHDNQCAVNYARAQEPANVFDVYDTREGDARREEFSQFCKTVLPKLNKYSRYTGVDANEGLMRVFKQWDKFRDLSHDECEAVVFNAVKYSALDRYRQEERQARREVPVSGIESGELGEWRPAGRTSTTVESGYERIVARQTAQALLRVLPPRERKVMERVIFGLSSREIAAELGLRPASVQTITARARRRLRESDEVREQLGIPPIHNT